MMEFYDRLLTGGFTPLTCVLRTAVAGVAPVMGMISAMMDDL
jgi:hypothetical protein